MTIALAAAPAALALWNLPAAAPDQSTMVVRSDVQTDTAIHKAMADEDATLLDLERLGLFELRDANAPQSDVFVKFRPAGAPIKVVPDLFEPHIKAKLSPSA